MLKGQTTIELTDVNTKQTEVFQKKNLVTNAVSDIFSNNPSGLLYSLYGSRDLVDQELFPIVNKCYGGILLFEDTLPEDAEQYYPPENNSVVGYASKDVNETDNIKRGSLNLTESTILDNGYKFVWDFSTSQANGVISSLALTHYTAGRAFYGDNYIANSSAIILNRISRSWNLELSSLFVTMVEADPVNNTFISIIPREDKTIEITRVKEPMTSLGLNDPIVNITPQKLDKVTIEADSFFEGMSTTYYIYFADGKDGYWYGFIRNLDNKNNKTILNRLRIDKTDYSITVDQWELEGVLLNNLGYYSRYSSGRVSRNNYSVLHGEYLYVFDTNYQNIYKINIHNPVDVSKIELGFTSRYSAGDYNSTYLYQWGEYICGYDFVIDQSGRVTRNAGYGLPYISTPLIKFGPLHLGYYSYNETFYKTLYLHSPYLGTINNLDTPILKTADKTMKIIYTLTEESEGSA